MSAGVAEVVCVGEAMALVSPDPPVALAAAERFVLTHGGAESNVAVSLARLGCRVQWCSRLGDDALGRRVRAEIDAAGVDTSLVAIDPDHRTGVYFKDPGPTGTRVHYYRDHSAASHMDERDFARALAARPRLLHLSGVTPALSPSCLRATRDGIAAARQAGVTVSFDVNYRPRLWSDPAAAARALQEIAVRCDVVFVGADEAQALWGETTVELIAQRLSEVATLVVKDGAGPAVSVQGATRIAVDALTVRVAEPVGAGDAFAAGWLRGLLTDMDPAQRLRLGHLIAAQSLRSTTDHAPDWPPVGALEDRARTGVPWPADSATRLLERAG